MDYRAPPPSYDEAITASGMPGSNPPSKGFPQGPPHQQPTAPYPHTASGPTTASNPPAIYTPSAYPPPQGTQLATPSAYPPPQGTQPASAGGFPQYSHSTVSASPVGPGGGQYPGTQVGNVMVTSVPNQRSQRSLLHSSPAQTKRMVVVITCIFVFVLVAIIIGVVLA